LRAIRDRAHNEWPARAWNRAGVTEARSRGAIIAILPQHEVTLRVRYAETDAMGFLHHANYFTYFEIGRTELLRASGGNYREMEERGLLIVVVKLTCRYRAPARYDDVLTLRTTLTRTTAAKIEHKYELIRDGLVLAEAESVLACVDRSGRVQPVPDEFQLDRAAEQDDPSEY